MPYDDVQTDVYPAAWEDGMTGTVKRVWIMTESRSLHDGLLALMTAIPRIEVTSRAGADVPAGQHQPDLVLVDMSLPGDKALAALRQIKAHYPLSRCIGLTDDVRQEVEAIAAGASLALPKGYPAVRLVAAVEDLLSGGREEQGAW